MEATIEEKNSKWKDFYDELLQLDSCLRRNDKDSSSMLKAVCENH